MAASWIDGSAPGRGWPVSMRMLSLPRTGLADGDDHLGIVDLLCCDPDQSCLEVDDGLDFIQGSELFEDRGWQWPMLIPGAR